MKNVLVIGGSYFAGKVFVEELSGLSQYEVYVVNRGNRPLNVAGVHEIICDRHDAESVAGKIPPLDWHAIVDFCAYDPTDVEILLQNLTGSIDRYIYLSTTTVLQDSHQLPMDEDTLKVAGPLPGPSGDYAYKKWLTELKLAELCQARAVNHISLRPAFIYGKYNYAPRESYFFNLIAQGKPIIIPSQPQALFSVVSVWDMANICIACLENENVGNNSYNVCSEELVSYDSLVAVLETITADTLDIRRQPLNMITVQNLPLPFPLKEHLVYSGSRLQEILNYRYMTLFEGMSRTYDWFLWGS